MSPWRRYNVFILVLRGMERIQWIQYSMGWPQSIRSANKESGGQTRIQYLTERAISHAVHSSDSPLVKFSIIQWHPSLPRNGPTRCMPSRGMRKLWPGQVAEPGEVVLEWIQGIRSCTPRSWRAFPLWWLKMIALIMLSMIWHPQVRGISVSHRLEYNHLQLIYQSITWCQTVCLVQYPLQYYIMLLVLFLKRLGRVLYS